MIKEIDIQGYKSINQLRLELGRINVFIGENGAGKSNILEVIALAGAAFSGKLDNEFLSSRGIRVAKPEQMRPRFAGSDLSTPIRVAVKYDEAPKLFAEISNDNEPYSKWKASFSKDSAFEVDLSTFAKILAEASNDIHRSNKNISRKEIAEKLTADALAALDAQHNEKAENGKPSKITLRLKNNLAEILSNSHHVIDPALSTHLGGFVIYSPENSLLRSYQREGQIEPLGINGEGMLRLLSFYSKSKTQTTILAIKERLKILGWFEDFKASDDLQGTSLEVADRYLDHDHHYLDVISANEGFLLLLFYFLLFSSELTPNFFAVDNIDTSLNPKLCESLTKQLVELAKANNKQAIVTTHNPSILDGLNLDDDEQRLFVISRGKSGETKIKRIQKPKQQNGDRPYRLSELFVRGVLGGLPKGFC